MLNIDYSDKRKFLMSLGITMIFIGALFYFGTMVFIVERTENALKSVIVENLENPEVQAYNQGLGIIYSTIMKGAVVPVVISAFLVILGFIFLLWGVEIWRKEDWK